MREANNFQDAVQQATCDNCSLRCVPEDTWAEIVEPTEIRFPGELREGLSDAFYAARPTESLYPEDGHLDLVRGLEELNTTVHLRDSEIALEPYNDEQIKEHFDASSADDMTRKALECLSKIAAGECTEADRERGSEISPEIDARSIEESGAEGIRSVIDAGSDDEVRKLYSEIMDAMEKDEMSPDGYVNPLQPTDDLAAMREGLSGIATMLDSGDEGQ